MCSLAWLKQWPFKSLIEGSNPSTSTVYVASWKRPLVVSQANVDSSSIIHPESLFLYFLNFLIFKYLLDGWVRGRTIKMVAMV